MRLVWLQSVGMWINPAHVVSVSPAIAEGDPVTLRAQLKLEGTPLLTVALGEHGSREEEPSAAPTTMPSPRPSTTSTRQS